MPQQESGWARSSGRKRYSCSGVINRKQKEQATQLQMELYQQKQIVRALQFQTKTNITKTATSPKAAPRSGLDIDAGEKMLHILEDETKNVSKFDL